MSDVSILKPNATPHEHALEQAIQKGKPDLTPIAQLMDPETCPAELLGWLAWAFSVDVWETTWTEATKREVIRRAIDVHRVKGTGGAVRRALASIGLGSVISEWFEHGGAPHTFLIDVGVEDVFAAGFLIDPDLVAEVDQVIRNVKPVRSKYELTIGEGMEAAGYVRTASGQRQAHATEHDPIPRPHPVVEVAGYARSGVALSFIDQVSHDVLPRSAV